MSHHFTGKVCIVTGAASGIGAATARLLAEHGASVVLADVQDTLGEGLAVEISAAGHPASYVHADMADEASVKAMVEHAVDTYGGLDVAINNAGIEGGSGAVAEQSEDDVHHIINVNLLGVFRCLRYEIPALLARGGGAIVNTASIAGLVGFQNAGAYTASKHGLVGLTKVAALDYATQNIRVNAVCPGVIDTPMIDRALEANPDMRPVLEQGAPMGRMGTAKEIAEAIVWLASDQASFMTGQAVAPDGGWITR